MPSKKTVQKKSHPTKSSQAPLPDALRYPEKISCSPAYNVDGKKFLVRFLTDDEAKADKSLPPYFGAKLGEMATEVGGLTFGLGALKDLTVDSFADTVAAGLEKAAQKLEEYQIVLSREVFDKVGLRQALRLLATAQSNAEFPCDLLKASDSRTKIVVKKTQIVLPQSFAAVAEPLIESALVEARHVNGMRQTQALPANVMTPTQMDQRAVKIAHELKLKHTSFDRKALFSMGAGGILAVAQGSGEEPRLIVLEYKHPRAKKTLALVGKGVTFDSGGISLKPGTNMHEMKYDMSGSAMALHSIAAIAEQKLAVNVVCAVAMVENMPDGLAVKPGDVYKALSGKTVEVQNTDAEGRLILADTLTYIQKHYKSNLLIDMATLTGACVVALGEYYAGLFSNNETARTLVEKAAAETGEPVWPLPIGKRYFKLLKSTIADINNIGGRYGGASTAAEFLHSFIEKEQVWAHLDIAGVGMVKTSFGVYPGSSSGYGVRLLAEVARLMAE